MTPILLSLSRFGGRPRTLHVHPHAIQYFVSPYSEGGNYGSVAIVGIDELFDLESVEAYEEAFGVWMHELGKSR